MTESTKDNHFDKRLRINPLKHIVRCPLFRSKWRQQLLLFITSTVLIFSMLAGCGPSIEDLQAVDYTPLPGDDWKVSTPVEQGLDPMLVAELYYNADKLETIYSLLVIKNSHLIAEGYFNEGSVKQKDRLQSVTKSYTSALVGIALEQGYLSSVDQKMLDFFPEIADQVTDSRKRQITIRHLLQMRAGYPWEETDPIFWDGLLSGHYPPLIEEFPLIADLGTEFHYSNLTSNWLGIIVFSRQLMWRQANGDRMRRAITTVAGISTFRLVMRPGSVCYISTTVYTMASRLFQPTGCMIPFRGTQRISI